jgi:hypothetical protein
MFRSTMGLPVLPIALLFPLAIGAQEVVIHGAAPAAVVEELKAELLPQNLTLDYAGDDHALFLLDRGIVAQRDNRLPVVHVTIEFQFHFKKKADGLHVTAAEEAVGQRGRPLEFRKPVDSARDNLQAILEQVRSRVEAAAPKDSAAKHDSTPQ